MNCYIITFNEIVKKYHVYEEEIQVEAKSLMPIEVIGNPERRDFPIIKGKEKLMQSGKKSMFFYGTTIAATTALLV